MDEKNGRADRVRLVERRGAAEHLLKLGIVASSRFLSKVGLDGVKLQAAPGTRLGPREPVLEVGDRIEGNHGADVRRLRGDQKTEDASLRETQGRQDDGATPFPR